MNKTFKQGINDGVADFDANRYDRGVSYGKRTALQNAKDELGIRRGMTAGQILAVINGQDTDTDTLAVHTDSVS